MFDILEFELVEIAVVVGNITNLILDLLQSLIVFFNYGFKWFFLYLALFYNFINIWNNICLKDWNLLEEIVQGCYVVLNLLESAAVVSFKLVLWWHVRILYYCHEVLIVNIQFLMVLIEFSFQEEFVTLHFLLIECKIRLHFINLKQKIFNLRYSLLPDIKLASINIVIMNNLSNLISLGSQIHCTFWTVALLLTRYRVE